MIEPIEPGIETPTREPRIVSDEGALEALVRALLAEPHARVAVDVESDGMFAYRARVCTVQIAAPAQIAIVDALATSIGPLGTLLDASGPVKIVHDVAFDARMLAENGIELGNVHDTSIAARMLGRTATGLASLARAELGIELDKALQHHDWRVRPLLPEHVRYLGLDVEHLDALATKLWSEVVERGIEEEVLEETRYRIARAVASARDTDRDPAYLDARGFDRLAPVERAILRRVFAVREEEAARINMPAARAIPTDALVALARAKPRTPDELAKLRLPRERVRPIASALLDAVGRGVDDGDVPAEDRERLERPRPSRPAIERRRAREQALSAWRKAEAKGRGVDEQVVLPGHCLKDLAEAEGNEVGTIASVAGFGACRATYVEAIALALAKAVAEGPNESG